MNILVTYDVSTTTPEGKRRLRQVARICEGFGQRVQYSVFEVQCSKTDYVRLLSALADIVVPDQDSLRIYPIDRDGLAGVVTIGMRRSFEVGEVWAL